MKNKELEEFKKLCEDKEEKSNRPSGNKSNIVFIIFLLLMIGIGVYYTFFLKDKKDSSDRTVKYQEVKFIL